ncbi:HU family DNA-binding protein [Mycoplasmopsis pulmonis]|nr:HU family DNA-binding protein [Mycoplasmopsis pulmonis]MDZ7293060.1 HU family DNA-binding protein [Mycoplasmopsis pulmonis]VEU67853.1 DNA-binding protein HU [Mycoplasmopsis pulmonis]
MFVYLLKYINTKIRIIQNRKVKTMTKKEFMQKISEHSFISQRDVEAIINSMVFVIKESLISEEKVTIPMLGTFETKIKAAREGIKFTTGEKILIPEKRVVKFKPTKYIKEVVNY